MSPDPPHLSLSPVMSHSFFFVNRIRIYSKKKKNSPYLYQLFTYFIDQISEFFHVNLFFCFLDLVLKKRTILPNTLKFLAFTEYFE